MASRRMLAGALVLGLLLVLVMGPGLAQEPEEAAQPAQGYEIEARVGSKFSYQGVLKEGNTPVSGRRDMVFRLYTDKTCATQVGADIVKTGVLAANGVFSVELEANHALFNGQALWLGVEVEGVDVACQEILPAPYALGLRPGAEIAGNGTVLSANSADGEALIVETGSTTDYDAAISGIATASSGHLYGVYGQSDSTDGGAGGYFAGHKGLYVWATGSSGNADGIMVYTAGDDGLHVEHADDDGVYLWDIAGDGVGIADAGGIGVYVMSAGEEGVLVWYAGGDGVNVNSTPATGVYANTNQASHEWGLYTPDKLYVGTTMVTGGALMLVAQNGDAGALEAGDVVAAAGLGQAFAGSQAPVTLVQRADRAGSQTVAGVVYGRLVAKEKVIEHDHEGQVERSVQFEAHSAEGPVAPGEHLLLCVLGPCPVKADAGRGAIQAGDLLGTGGGQGRAALARALTLEGVRFYAPGTTLGTALEPLEAGTGLIQVLVMPR